MGAVIQRHSIPIQKKRSTSSMLGEALGSGLGQGLSSATNMYLQGKFQDMLAEKENARAEAAQDSSAKGLSSLFPEQQRQQIYNGLKSLPTSQHPQVAKLLFENFGQGSGVANDYITKGGRAAVSNLQAGQQQQPQQMQQQVQPTPQNIAMNMDAMQRMGQGLPPGVMPGYPQAAGGQPFLPLTQQNQPAIGQDQNFRQVAGQQGQVEQPETPAGVVPPKTVQEASPSGNDVEEPISDSEFRTLLSHAPNKKMQDRMVASRKMEMDNYYKSKSAQQAEGKNSLAREKFEWQKTEAEKKQTREIENKDVHAFIGSIEHEVESIPLQKNLLAMAENSLKTGNFGLLSPDNIANYTGIEAFRTAEGEALRNAAKGYLLSDVKSLGTKSNMMLDKQLMSILPDVGKTYEGNMAWVAAQKMKMDLTLGKAMFLEQLKGDYTDKKGNISPGLATAVNKKMIEYSDLIQNKTAYNIQQIQEQNAPLRSLESLRPVKDTFLTPKRAKALTEKAGGDKEKAIQAALKLGYKIPDKSFWE